MGRETDGSSVWKIFPNPTKNQSNEGTSYISYAQNPEMSITAGFYIGAQTLEIFTPEPNATIYYTTNGELPDEDSSIYTGPLSISETQIVKAIVIPDDDIDVYQSFISFNTYFINEEHHLPVLSTSANQLTTLLNGNQSLKPHGTIEYFEMKVQI